MHVNTHLALEAGSMLSAPSLVLPERRIRKIVSAFAKDQMMTFDSGNSSWSFGAIGSMMQLDGITLDNAGAFLISELERLDPKLYEPLVNYTWGRDIDLRTDVTIADELSSFINTNYGSPGGITPTGIAWASKKSNMTTGVAVDLGKQAHPLTPWEMELEYSLLELASSLKVNRPIDEMKFRGLNLKYQMDIDTMVYIGDATLGYTGLTNSDTTVGHGNVLPGGQGGTTWASKTPQEMLNDVNGLLTANWAATGYSRMPDQLRIPPTQFGVLVNTIVSQAGNTNVINYLAQNSLSNTQNGRPLNIQPLKWLIGRGSGGLDRIMAYTKDEDLVRYPMTPLLKTPVEQHGTQLSTTYYCRLGVLEFPYPETVRYADGV